MASYTDAISSYSPYVSQMPLIQERSLIGREKQQQYNEGIQKIQTSIDNVAGLDVMRDVDKQYLQSRLNELGTNLKSVAAADFSNNQMVTSTAGMASRIGKDPIIQNSVISTQRVRKAMSDKEIAKQEGKGSPENEWDLNNQVGDYLNNPDTKASFSGGYNPYTDVNKKMWDIYSKLKDLGSDVEDPFQKDDKGNYITDVKGNKVASPIMIETILKGNSSSQIANAVRVSLDQNDLKQLSITGRYAYRGISNSDLKQETFNTYTQHIKTVQDRIDQLQQMSILQSKNPQAVSDFNKTIMQLKSDIAPDGYFVQQLNQAYHTIDINPEGVKSQLYKDKTITAFANGYANETKAIKFLENPEEKIREWGLDYSQRNTFHRDQMSLGWANAQTSKDRLTWEQNKDLIEHMNNNPTNLGGLDPTKKTDYYTEAQNAISTSQSQLFNINDQIRDGLVNELRDKPGVDDRKLKTFRDSLTDEKIAAFVTGQDIPEAPYKTQFPTTLDGLLRQRKDVVDDVNTNKHALKIATDKVNNDPALKAKLAALPSIQITMPDGSNKILAPQEVQSTINSIETKLDNAPAITGMLHSINKTLGPGKTNDFFNWMSKRLYTNLGGDLTKTLAEGTLQDLNIGGNFIASLVGVGKPFSSTQDIDKWFNYVKYNLTPTELQLYNQMNHNEDNGIPFARKNYPDLTAHLNVNSDFIKARNDVLATVYPEYGPKWKEIDNKLIPKEVLKTTAGNILASNVETSKGNSSYDKGSLEKLLTNKPDDLNFKVVRTHEQPFLVLSKTGDASSTQMIPISEELAAHYGLPFDPDAKLLGRIIKNGRTTNTTGGTPEGAYIRQSTDKYNIAIDFKPSATDDTLLYPFLSIATPNGWETHQLIHPYDLAQARQLANQSFSNETIEEILKNNKIKIP